MNSLNLESELEDVSRDLASVDKEIQVLSEKRHGLLQRKREIEQILKQKSVKVSQPEDISLWNKENFSWSHKLRSSAKDVFGINEFRELQLPCINATLSKADCILIIPTGAGKSLCFQLSAVLSSGWTLVISPLISLMEDQVMRMQKLSVDARLLAASTEKDVTKAIMDDMVNSKSALKLLYVTPERLAKSKTFMSRLEKAHQLGFLSRIAIDEVHCCSTWGHDFRPDYKFLGILRQQFPGVPLLCLTATASAEVIEDVKTVLNLPAKTILFRSSFNRPNLFYEVVEKPSVAAQCYELIATMISKEFPDAEEVAVELQRRGIKTGFYHADINPGQRSEIHQKWVCNKINVVVATIAFGLGIDKPDVRFVIHHSLSKSCENYYQESGRCGRDGMPARCILLFRLADVFRISCMVFHERATLPKLYAMLKYAYSLDTCRRKLMAEIFGEAIPNCHGKCDICTERFKVVTTECSQLVTDLLPELVPGPKGTKLTFNKALDKLSKLKSAKASNLPIADLERLIANMLLDGIIKEDFHFTPYSTISYLVPSIAGSRQLERNSISVTITRKSGATRKKRIIIAQQPLASPSKAVSSKKVKQEDLNVDDDVIILSPPSNDADADKGDDLIFD